MKCFASLLAFALLASASFAQFTETEPNETKAQANVIAGLTAGGTITGITTGASTTVAGPASADTFDITTAALPLGTIYEHTLTLSSATVGHTVTIRGLNQTTGVIGTTDSTMQTSQVSGTNRVVKWYGFGRSERLYVRVAGTATTTAPYVMTMASTPAAVTCLASLFAPGTVTVSTVGQTTTDTDLWVYDSSLTAIPNYGNDDEPAPGTTLQSRLARSYAAGTYYVAVSRFECGNSLASPTDDRYRSGLVTDFADLHVFGSSATGFNCNMTISDGILTTPVTLTTPALNGVGWVRFTVGTGGSPSPAWETNSAGMDLNVNGVQNTVSTPNDTTLCVNALGTLNIQSTNVGFGWDMAYGLLPGLAGPTACGAGTGGIPTPGGQTVNINLADPTLGFFNLLLFPPFAGPIALPISIPAPVPNISAQAIVFSASHPDGFELSALLQLHVVAGAASIPGPVGDDIALSLIANSGPNCFPAVSMYGTTYTQYHVITNGRVTMGTADTSFSPSAAAGGPAFAGCWTDFNTAIGGTITVNNTGTGVRVDYNGMGYFGQAGTASTFNVEFFANGDVSLGSLAIGAPTTAVSMYLGVSPGAGAAIAGGVPAAPWALGSGTYAGTSTEAIGVFGTAGPATLVNGLTSVLFANNGSGYTISL